VNQLQLYAAVIEREPVRYTPAGVPVLNCTLSHCSQAVEAGVARQVEITIPAIAAGELSGALAVRALGCIAHFSGFLARLRRNSRTLVFHITELHELEED
jgi:primosomal replication protein N